VKELACDLPAGLEVDFGWLLGQALTAYLSATKRAAESIPSGHRGYQVLSAAVHESARNQIEMARQLGLDRTVMVYLVDDLVKAGLVERRPDPGDRRNRLIVATAEGHLALARVAESLEHAEASLLAPLEGDEREAFRELLRRVVAGHLADGGEQPAASMCEMAQNLKDTLALDDGDAVHRQGTSQA
jgi:DNA-binding MarR family transcriptional regulator